MIAAAWSEITEAPMSLAAHIMSTTMPDGPSAFSSSSDSFLKTISLVIGIGGPSTGGSSHR